MGKARPRPHKIGARELCAHGDRDAHGSGAIIAWMPDQDDTLIEDRGCASCGNVYSRAARRAAPAGSRPRKAGAAPRALGRATANYAGRPETPILSVRGA